MTTSASFAVEGELTIYRAAELCDALRAAFERVGEGDALDIDLSAVTEMDSAGVQLLMAARKTALASRRRLCLVAASPAVADVFNILQLGAHFAPPAAA